MAGRNGSGRGARALATGLLALLTACGVTDVVARYAASSLGTVASRMGTDRPDPEGFFALTAPSGDVFFLASRLDGSIDAILDLDAAPFLAARLDPASLSAEGEGRWTVADGRLRWLFALAEGGANDPDAETVAEALSAFARARVGYHAPMRHYVFKMAGQAMVEWAADPKTNDKEWGFVFDPDFLRSVGVDPSKLEGWALGNVPVEGAGGAMVDKALVLRPFDLP